MIEENAKMSIPALGNEMIEVMVLCLGEAIIWVKYKKTGVEAKTGREVSIRLCLLRSWMISMEGLCPGFAWGHSFWHQVVSQK